jgi:hypothetical protein
MSDTSLPKPLSAYVGLLVASLEEARAAGHSTAGQVVRLPFAAAGQILTARSRYDDLAQTGDRVVDVVVGLVRQHFGSGHEEASEWVGDELSSARGRANAALALTTDVAEQVAGKLTGVAGKAASTVTSLAGTRSHPSNGKLDPRPTELIEPVAEALEKAAERVAATAAALDPEPEVVGPPTVSPPAAPEPELTPLQQIEQFSVPEEIGKQAGGLKSAADLPLADFDHMSAPQLRGRLRRLDRVQLVQLLDYERAHADRVGIVLLLENRLTKLMAAGS